MTFALDRDSVPDLGDKGPSGPRGPVPAPMSFLAGGGEMGALIRAMDWSRTPIGPIENWSPSLRTSVDIMLSSRYAMFVWWGQELTNLYNDAYRPFLGKKHPQSLGKSARDVWAEIWHLIGPRTAAVLDRGESTFDEALLLVMERFGYPEETYFTFSYSPIHGERGDVGGIFCAVTDETQRVIGERRLRLLREVAAASSETHTPEQICAAAAHCMMGNARDIPFGLIYLADDEGQRARLAAQVNIEPGSPAAPAVIDLGDAASLWPLATAAAESRFVVVEDLDRMGQLPSGAWDRPPQRAVVVPLKERGQSRVSGFLIAALNPYLVFDEEYRGFVGLLADQITAGIAAAQSFQEERRRAEALAEIDRAKTLFFSNVSHEFRTPLTLMMGPLEDALASPDLPPAERERLDATHRNSLRLLKLVNTLLDFSRIEAGRVRASYEPLDLSALTAELASNFRSACERANLSLTIDCPALPQPVHVDRDMWEKVVLNLLSNAFKFTFDGGITVRLRAVDGRAVLTVRDTGVGIPADELPRLFERFHRIEGQRSRTYEGSGIGLALVQELVRLHHGTITAESPQQGGTVFTISLPLARSPLAAGQVGAPDGRSSTSVRAEAYVQEALRWLPDAVAALDAANDSDGPEQALECGGRVLVVDDNADMRAYLERLLRGRCEVRTAADGEAALRAIAEQRPDLVVTDVMMPGVDGFGLVRAIRSDPALRDMSIIMLSARAGEESRVEGVESGADDYLVKPFSSRELVARVSANLKLTRARRDTEAAMRESAEQRLRAAQQFETLLNQAPLGVYLVDADFRLRAVNPVAQPAFGDIPDLIGRDFDEVTRIRWPKPYADEIVQRFRHTLETGEPYETPERIEQRLDRKTTEYYEWRIDRIRLGDGRFGVVCYFRDISGQVAARERLKLLIDELNHRVKNTLASVQSIAVQTLRNAANVTEGRRGFEDRLIALAKAHDVLTRGHWEGADIHEVIDGSLAAYRTGNRLAITGPNLKLLPKTALALSLALHELATNAAKYGAFANGAGRVDMDWSVDTEQPRRFRLRWAETGGPPVSVPQRRGFGSRLIQQGLAHELAAEVHMDFAPSGLVCSISAPIEEISG